MARRLDQKARATRLDSVGRPGPAGARDAGGRQALASWRVRQHRAESGGCVVGSCRYHGMTVGVSHWACASLACCRFTEAVASACGPVRKSWADLDLRKEDWK